MKTKITKSFLVILFFASLLQVKSQCVYTIQPGPRDGKDAQIFSMTCEKPYAQTYGTCDTTNFGNSNSSSVTAWTFMSDLGISRSYMQFDLTQAKTISCNVKRALLVLSHNGNSIEYHCGDTSSLHSCNNNSMIFNRVAQSWGEMTLNWDNQPNFINNIQGQDFINIPDNSIPYNGYQIEMTDMVNFWLAHPDSNFGFRMALAAENYYSRTATATSDHADPERRPKLILFFDCGGNACTNLITGNIFDETQAANCVKDSADRNLAGWMVKIEPGPMYAITDSTGYYEAWVDTGTFTVSEIIPTLFWNASCPLSHTVTFSGSGDTSKGNDFANTASKNCSSLWLDVATGRLRPMHNENYIVNYCNKGNAPADSVKIDVSFDNFIVPNYSSPDTPVSKNGNVWTYYVGTLAPGQCGMFYINTTVNSTTAGITQCVRAEISPNTFCGEPVDSTWDKSSMKVSGNCNGDSTSFVIINHGSGNMTDNSNYRIFINDTLAQTNAFKLNRGDSLVITLNACGNTIRLEADQRPGHPGYSHPRATVEGCGSACGSVVFGHVTTVPQDDADNFVATDCHEIITSWDPNEKLVAPKGVTSGRYVSSKDELEYTLNFQNTGQDTAFLIVVRDTLPQYLDLTTVQSGASSHLYSLKVYGTNVLEWTFKNINLVDSNTNEPGSHSFVKFKVKQKPGNPDGTVISNSGGIYFDYNAPVQTEKVTVRINDALLGIKKLTMENGLLSVKIYPNPFTNSTTLRITNWNELQMKKVELKIFNVLGMEVFHSVIKNSQSEIQSNDLNSGLYIYKLYSEKNLVGTGKLLIQK